MAACLASARAADSSTVAPRISGTILSKRLVAKTTLRTGVVLRRYHATVAGLPTQEIDEVTWTLGSSHISLHSTMLGSYSTASQSIGIRTISSWNRTAQPAHVVAALNGDFFTDAGIGAVPSSTLVIHRRIYHFGRGAPAVGFLPHGDMIIGNPLLYPTRIYLPNSTATVYAWNQPPPRANGDQVAVYSTPGRVVPIPTGYRAVIVAGQPFRHGLRGTNHVTNSTGLNKQEAVSSFYYLPAGTATTKLSFPITTPPTGATSVTVPPRRTVLIMTANGIASAGFDTDLAKPTPSVTISTSDPAWSNVSDVMGGKPQVVKNHTAITAKDAYTTNDQWYSQQWRPAIATTTTGKGMLIVIGGLHGATSTTGVQFARMLAALGAKNAIQFDNRSSSELFLTRPNHGGCATTNSGTCYTMSPGWERTIPVATSLTYRP